MASALSWSAVTCPKTVEGDRVLCKGLNNYQYPFEIYVRYVIL